MTRLIALVALGFSLGALISCRQRAAVVEIPDGYVGWVNVRYEDQSCPDANESLTRSVIRVGEDGIGCSKTWSGEGLGWREYFYVNQAGQRIRELRSSGWGAGGEIWASAGSLQGNISSFFVGSEEAFKETKTGSLNHLRENRPEWVRP